MKALFASGAAEPLALGTEDRRYYAPRRLPIRKRDWSSAQRMLRSSGVTQRAISQRSGVPISSVNRALCTHRFRTTQFAIVARVRRAAESLLGDAGLNVLADTLWSDYPLED